MFSDSITVDKILRSDTPYEAKKLGYQVAGMDYKQWIGDDYNLCYEGVKAKFQQNPDLLNMLKTTHPKLLVERTNDKTWGTGIHLRIEVNGNPTVGYQIC